MDETANRFLDALEMWEDGVQIMRENLRRRAPRATDEEIEAELTRWLAGPDGTRRPETAERGSGSRGDDRGAVATTRQRR